MKTKRTYRLSNESIATVKRLAEVDHVAETQDGVVDRAIQELDRSIRDSREAQLWAKAATDQGFLAEAALIDSSYAPDEKQAWEER